MSSIDKIINEIEAFSNSLPKGYILEEQPPEILMQIVTSFILDQILDEMPDQNKYTKLKEKYMKEVAKEILKAQHNQHN